MTDTLWIILLLVMGLGIAYTTSRSSNKREKIYGGAVSQVSHYFAAGLIAMLAPTVLCNVFFIHPDFLGTIMLGSLNLTAFIHAVLIALLMLGTALVFLMPFALSEKPHLDKVVKQADKGWTKEDAETSGL
jgi:hypothetical protein